jgi:short-subunit dehydrogenase
MNKRFVLITGASSGIGSELAEQFAKNRHAVILTGRMESELQLVADKLRNNHAVESEIIVKDLEDINAPQQIYDEITQKGYEIDILVNNAGLGQRGNFWDIPIEKDISILRVNVEAVLRLTKLFLPLMVSRRRGRILNTASIAGFEPGPLLAVYHASKAFVLSFSEALATELKDTGVTVTALCPGPTDTKFFTRADMESTKAFQKGPLMSPLDVAKQGYEALMRGDRLCVTGGVNKALVFSRRMLPESMQAKFNEKMYEEVEDKSEREKETVDVP